ncbi:MAG: tetratricopeptide repeat protein, partial [candidate division WOR-3 bacterium]
SGTEEGVEFLQGLSKEVEGFIAASESETAQEPAPVPEDLPQLEGQIADIEFLLKETESPPIPTLEVEQEFRDFQKAIAWEPEDSEKRLAMAKTAYDAELYETALNYIEDMKDDKTFWPQSLEIISGSWIKLGNYNEAIKILGQAILHEEIPETQKFELRYLLTSAYESLGDFENALREIEHIMRANPQYKDVRELYSLLGGTEIFKEPQKVVPEEPIKEEVTVPGTPEVIEKPIQKTAPEQPLPEEIPRELQAEKIPEPPSEEIPRELPAEKIPEMLPEEQPILEKEAYPTIIEKSTTRGETLEKQPEKIDIIKKTENIAFL